MEIRASTGQASGASGLKNLFNNMLLSYGIKTPGTAVAKQPCMMIHCRVMARQVVQANI